MPSPFSSALNPDGSLTVGLPIPDRSVSPNARRGQSRWAAIAKSREVKRHRQMAQMALQSALNEHRLVGRAWRGYALAFFFKTAAFRDDDNADGSCKGYRDGICDVLGISDRYFRKVALSTHAKDAKDPRVEVTLFLEKGLELLR